MTERRPPLVSIALVSAASLAWEILLLRLFSITQFHHTAYMVISLALLGFGASGVVLTFAGERWRRRFDAAYGALLLAVAPSMLASFALAQRLMVFPDEMLWDPRLALRVGGVYVLLALPFLLIGTALGLALMRFRPQRIYAWDLLGAGTGSLLVVGLLLWLPPEAALRGVATLACLAAAVALPGGRRRLVAGAGLALVAAVWLAPAAWVEPRLSPYKGLSQALRIEGARVAAELSSPLALVTAVENDFVPVRHAPGLSLAAPRGPADQVALFLDAGALTPIVDARADADLAYLDYLTAALPYRLAAPRSVLVLGAGGGEGVLRALRSGATEVVGVEIDRQIVSLVRNRYGELSGRLYDRSEVEIATTDIRGFVARDHRRWDLIEQVALGGFGGGGLALTSLSEDYLTTVEALGSYLDRLSPGGMLTMTTWVRNPPRATLKLTGVVVEALERRGVEAPGDRLVVVRGWQTGTLVVKNGAWSGGELEALREFCAARYFDLVHYPGMLESEANRFNRLDGPVLHRAVRRLLGPGRESFVAGYPFDVRAPTDDRPFFHQFFRWRSLPEIVAARGRGGLPLLEAGYLVLVVTLAQAVVAGLALVVLAWIGVGGRRGSAPTPSIGIFFAALGLAFLFFEVAYLQRFILFLHHPVQSAAVVLASFLIFAGAGSAASTRLVGGGPDGIGRALLAVVGLGLVELAALPALLPWLAAAPGLTRVLAAVALVAPLAFFMGMPFPLGLALLREDAPALVPWAWGANACASVVSPVLATLVALHLGFGAVVLLALGTYAVAAALARRAF